jgi:quinone-modifying oxidoreductase subunit QmoB
MAIETKVGVYLCSGCEIGDCLNMDELAKVATDENKTPVCKINPWLCSEESIDIIKKDIDNEKLNWVVIGACSQRFLSDIFKFDTNVLVDRVNLRENVAWTHKPNDEDTQMLASDYLRMGIAKVQNSEPPEATENEINETILVVGGGVSGLTAALAAAKADYEVILTEKESQLGGWLNKIYKIGPTQDPFTTLESSKIEDLISEVEANNKIKVIKSCKIDKISGQPGNFDVKYIANNNSPTEPVKVGAIIQATGWKQYKPEKLEELGYGKFDNVITNMQL